MTETLPAVPVFEADGARIPKIGLGTYGLEGEGCARAVCAALGMGYRHLDTAEMYGNERAVGEGLRASGVAREDVFVTSKVWHDHLAPDAMTRAAEASLERLGLSVLDLYLIHWPSPTVSAAEAVKALCAVHRRGLTRAVGISNFPVALVEEAVAAADVPLAVNQVEYHPYLDQSRLLAALARHGMGLTAYCPLARGKVAQDPVIARIAARHGTTAGAVTLAWLIGQDRVIAIPKSGSPERLGENLAAASLSLPDEDAAAISGLARPDGRLVNPAHAPRWDEAA